MNKPKKYLVYREGEDQELMVGLTDRDIMVKALQKYGIKIKRIEEGDTFAKKVIV